jgi:ketosteroid isomerase-like protein
MSVTSTEVELREWLDRLAIQDLIHRYSDSVTRADWELCEALYAQDAIWESPGLGMRYEGRDALMEMLRATSGSDILIQTAHNSVVKLTGVDEAQATTTTYEFMRGKLTAESELGESGTEANIEQYGTYFDDVTRMAGEWKFTHRLFVPIYVGDNCVTGKVLTLRTALLRP